MSGMNVVGLRNGAIPLDVVVMMDKCMWNRNYNSFCHDLGYQVLFLFFLLFFLWR
jgi:hypothetical protein